MDRDKLADSDANKAESQGSLEESGRVREPGDNLSGQGEEGVGDPGGGPGGNGETASSGEASPAGLEGAVRLTQVAADKVREIATDEGFSAFRLRVKVVGGGCAGFAYDLAFDEKVTNSESAPAMPEDPVSEMDVLLNVKGVAIIVDQMSLMYLRGTEIDFMETLMGGGFKFNNPNVTNTCGCGQSFQV